MHDHKLNQSVFLPSLLFTAGVVTLTETHTVCEKGSTLTPEQCRILVCTCVGLTVCGKGLVDFPSTHTIAFQGADRQHTHSPCKKDVRVCGGGGGGAHGMLQLHEYMHCCSLVSWLDLLYVGGMATLFTVEEYIHVHLS